jgi:quinoprotein glucose dehydrogenase
VHKALVVVLLSLSVAMLPVRSGSTQARPEAPARQAYTSWPTYLGGAHSAQYSALDQINRTNVRGLQVVWTFPAGNRTNYFNPIVVDGVMYVVARANDVVALDARTGKEIWSHANDGAVSGRGINYWESADRADRRLLYINRGALTAVDARTGQTIASFGQNGRVDLRDALAADGHDVAGLQPFSTNNPGRVFEDLMIVSLPAQGAGYESTPGDVQAYDVRTGRLRWIFHSIPHDGEFGADTWPKGAWRTHGGVHNWSELTVDEGRGIAYIPFGTARFDYYGGDREGQNLFANSIVALDARTGKRLWHQQLVHHDVWDYDLPTAPKLLTIRQNGTARDVVAQPTKMGFLFVFDRVTGAPIWPIEERPVPQSDVPGEKTWPTQPFPTRPAPFARQSFTEKDINPFIPQAEQQFLRDKLKSVRNEGLYTPPSFQGSIQMPGHNGGANWGSAAVDPDRGELYVVAKSMPTLLKITLEDAPRAPVGTMVGPLTPIVTPAQREAMMAQAKANAAKGPVRYNSPFDFMLTSTNLPSVGPPWSLMTAYDLNTGVIRWQVPVGTVTAPKDVGIPENSGAHWTRGGLLVTAGGLLFVATSSDKTLRAFDRDTGQALWSTVLPAVSEGVPATYAIDGRQYLALSVAGGHGFNPARFGGPPLPAPPGSYMVFALPAR